MFSKLIALNFKTTNGVTYFFKNGIFSKGVAVDEYQADQLRKCLRHMYWRGLLPMMIAVGLVGPLLTASFFPAIILSYYMDVNDILEPNAPPDRITLTENVRRLSLAIPSWFQWLVFFSCTALVLLGCTWFMSEAIQVHRAARLGVYYEDSLIEAASGVAFFSIGSSVFKAMLDVRRRAMSSKLSQGRQEPKLD